MKELKTEERGSARKDSQEASQAGICGAFPGFYPQTTQRSGISQVQSGDGHGHGDGQGGQSWAPGEQPQGGKSQRHHPEPQRSDKEVSGFFTCTPPREFHMQPVTVLPGPRLSPQFSSPRLLAFSTVRERSRPTILQ